MEYVCMFGHTPVGESIEIDWFAIQGSISKSEELSKLSIQNTRIDVQTRMYIVGINAVLDNELSEFEIFTPSVFFGQLRQ